MYDGMRELSLMRKQNVQATLAEINRVLGFKLALEYWNSGFVSIWRLRIMKRHFVMFR